MERMSKELKEHIEETLEEQEFARQHMRNSTLMTEGICNMAKDFIDNVQGCVLEAMICLKYNDYKAVELNLRSVKEQLDLLWKGLDV